MTRIEFPWSGFAPAMGKPAPTMLLEPGVIDDQARIVFGRGHCHSLALAIHELTGWPLAGMYDFHGTLSHVLVWMPDGMLLDVNGVRTEEEVNTTLGDPDDYVCELTEDDIELEVEWNNLFEPMVEEAKPFAKALLAKNGFA